MQPSEYNIISKWQYIFKVKILPVLFALAILVFLLFLIDQLGLDKSERVGALIISIAVYFILRLTRFSKWLRLSENSYIRASSIKVDDEDKEGEKRYEEPATYEIEFYYATSEKIAYLASGVLAIFASFWIVYKGVYTFSLILLGMSSIFFYTSYKRFADTLPDLKIAKSGIWVKDYGYRPWYLIKEYKIEKEENGRQSSTYLKIYLKDKEFEYPDVELEISCLKNNNEILSSLDKYFKNQR